MIDLPVVFILQKDVLSFEYLTSDTETKWKLKIRQTGGYPYWKTTAQQGQVLEVIALFPPLTLLLDQVHFSVSSMSVRPSLRAFTSSPKKFEVPQNHPSSCCCNSSEFCIQIYFMLHYFFCLHGGRMLVRWKVHVFLNSCSPSHYYIFSVLKTKHLLCLQDCLCLETDILKAFFKVQGWEDSSRPQHTSASILNRELPADTVVLLLHLSTHLIIRISTFKICEIHISCSFKLEGSSRQHRSRVQGWRASLECECECVQRALSTLGSRPECSGCYVRAHQMNTSLFSQKTAANVGSLLLQHHGLLEVQHHGERLVLHAAASRWNCLERKYTYTRTHTHSCTPPSITSVLYCSVLSPSCEQRRGISVSSSVPPRCPLGLKCPFIARRYLIGLSISPYRCVARTSASLYSRRLSAAALLVLGL